MSQTPASVALQKLTRVFGDERGRALLADGLLSAGLKEITSAEDLMKLARALEKRGGLERAVGAMLSVQAVMMGAKG